MKVQNVLFKITGFINLFFVGFHLAFYRMFNWKVELNNLTHLNKAIFLTYHCICILMLLFMAVVSLFWAKTLLENKLKYIVLGMFVAFYVVRIVSEFTFFGFTASSPKIILLCMIPVVLYMVLMVFDRKTVNRNL